MENVPKFMTWYLVSVIALEPNHDGFNFIALVLVSTGLSLFTTAPGVPAVMTPLAAVSFQIRMS